MTLIGQSSGGTSILAQLASPSARGLFASGAPMMPAGRTMTQSVRGGSHFALRVAQHLHEPEPGHGAPPAIRAGHELLVRRPEPRAGLSLRAHARGHHRCVRHCAVLLPLSRRLREGARAYACALYSTPDSWLPVNFFPASPAGNNNVGLPVVDGVTIPMPLKDALLSALVDVPVILEVMIPCASAALVVHALRRRPCRTRTTPSQTRARSISPPVCVRTRSRSR
jgi:hypothetical protein